LLELIAFSAAHALIYLRMKTEDYALLIGSVAAFGAIALNASPVISTGAARAKARRR
jgi:inner membrane protein involved in colicin E2 resistance